MLSLTKQFPRLKKDKRMLNFHIITHVYVFLCLTHVYVQY